MKSQYFKTIQIRLPWACILFWQILSVTASLSADVTDPRLEIIARSWAARSRSAPSGKVVFTVRAYDGNNADDKLQFSAVHTFCWDENGKKRWYNALGEQPSMSKGKMTLDNTLADDGASGWRQVTPPNERARYPVGFVNSARWGRRELLPISWHYGLQVGRLAIIASNLRILDLSYPLDKHSGVLLEDKSSTSYRRHLVVDPTLNNSIVRVLQYSKTDGALERQWEMNYRFNAAAEAELTGWTFSSWDSNAKVSLSEQAEFSHTKTNIKFDPQLFKLQFPVGAWVYDEINKHAFIQRENGIRRIVTAEEDRESPSYAVLLATESGKATNAKRLPDNPPTGGGPNGLRWVIAINFGILMLVVMKWTRHRFGNRSG